MKEKTVLLRNKEGGVRMVNIKLYPNKRKNEVSPYIYGHFSEIAFGNIPGGFYDPDSEMADEDGFRKDVIEAMRQVKTPLIRFPGGNYVSNYRWERGIGPKEKRPRVYDYAWHAEDNNQFGTVEFIKFCKKVGAEPLICVNMGSGTVDEAMNWVEFCNGTADTYYANMRRKLGDEEPFGVKYWGLGNEMYGVWQLNHLNAEDYAHKAFQFAHGMKSVDPGIFLIASGLETEYEWDMEVVRKLTATYGTGGTPEGYRYLDAISAHHYSMYWDNAFTGAGYEGRMAISGFIDEKTRLIRAAVEVASGDVHCPVGIAWDEWNMFGWEFDGVEDDRTYTLENAVVTASVLNSFIRNSGIVCMANYSTFVNINGAVSTKEHGIVKRAQFPVFELYGNKTEKYLAETETDSESFRILMPHDYRALQRQRPGRTSDAMSEIPYLDSVATVSEDGSRICLHVVNKNQDKAYETVIRLMESAPEKKTEAVHYEIYHEDIKACNTAEAEEVRIEAAPLEVTDEGIHVVFREHSVNIVEIIQTR